MNIVTASNGTKRLVITREEWEKIGQAQGWTVEAKRKKKGPKKEWDPNPWAVCTESIGRKNKEKYERCVKHVKEKQQ